MNTKTIITFLLCIGLITVAGSAFSAPMIKQNIKRTSQDYINLTVEEVWDLLSDTANGIQLPIDVRTDGEWNGERIDTPFPEFPRHFEKSEIIDSEGYLEFVDLYDGNDVIIYCKSGGRSAAAASTLIDRGFNGTVYNMLGGITAWKGSGYSTKTGNTNPAIPNEPTGSTICNLNESCEFSTQAADPDEDPIRYGWDWNNDDIVDEWTDYAPSAETISIFHVWNTIGTYTITVKAQDIVGDESSFSTPLLISINTPPNAPRITGKNNGKAGEEYEYSMVSEDEDDHEISYLIEWGDGTTSGWTRTLPSGEAYNTTHIWEVENTYTIRVKAKDNYEAESDWATLEVQMPHNHLLSALKQFIFSYPILQHLFLSRF